MSRTIVVNSSMHLTKERRANIEQKIQEKFPDDRILILEPEFKIQLVVPEK